MCKPGVARESAACNEILEIFTHFRFFFSFQEITFQVQEKNLVLCLAILGRFEARLTMNHVSVVKS